MTESLASLEVAYRYLARVFHEAPDAAFIGSVAAGDLMSEWPLDAAREHTRTGVRLMKAFCAAWDEGLLPELESAFHRLFAGPGRPLAPPWESYYVNRDRLLFQEETLAVRRAYSAFGLQPPKPGGEPDDSLGLELAFVSEVCARSVRADETGDEKAAEETVAALREFLAMHLLRWAPECLRLVIDGARLDYYRAAAHLGLGCLAETAALLGIES